jgi:hypothetical protein
VTGAKNIKIRGGQNRLDENLQRSAADQAGVVFRILIQIERPTLMLRSATSFLRPR